MACPSSLWWPKPAGCAFHEKGPEVTQSARFGAGGTPPEVLVKCLQVAGDYPILNWLRKGVSLPKLQHRPQTMREFHVQFISVILRFNLHIIKCIDFRYDWISFDKGIHRWNPYHFQDREHTHYPHNVPVSFLNVPQCQRQPLFWFLSP